MYDVEVDCAEDVATTCAAGSTFGGWMYWLWLVDEADADEEAIKLDESCCGWWSIGEGAGWLAEPSKKIRDTEF